MKFKIISYIILISLLSYVFIFFQNCGDVNLSKLTQQSSVRSFNLTARIEPNTSKFTADNRIVFMVDMSLSNLGLHQYSQINPTQYEHKIITDSASDKEAKRLSFINDLIKTLISSSIKFSVIGFHDSAILDPKVESCSSPFVQGENILINEIPYLKGIHNYDLSRSAGILTSNTISPYSMGETSYLNAFSCLEQKILKESIFSQGISPFYNLIFVTDGEPSDFRNIKYCTENSGLNCDTELNAQFSGCRNKNSEGEQNECFKNLYSKTIYPERLNAIKNGLFGKNLGIKFYPIYYGRDENYDSAKSVLDELSHIFDPQINTQKITNFSDVFESLQKSLNIQLIVPYLIENFSAINLTAIPNPDEWIVDSNMNGIPDQTDLQNLNSVGDENSDPSLMSKTSIRKIFDSYRSVFNLDGDDLPSFIEVIRGSSPEISDSNYLSDGDGLNTFYKVLNSLALNNSEIIHPTRNELKPKLAIRQIQPNLPLDPSQSGISYELELTYMPLVKGVSAYQDEGDPSAIEVMNFSHENDENLILIFYTAIPTHSLIPRKKFFGALVKMKEGGEPIKLSTGNFLDLGDL